MQAAATCGGWARHHNEGQSASRGGRQLGAGGSRTTGENKVDGNNIFTFFS